MSGYSPVPAAPSLAAVSPPAKAWEFIRAGRRPDDSALGSVAQADSATLGSGGVAEAEHRLRVQLLGAGPLEPLLDDPRVTDVAVNGDGRIWADVGAGMQPRGELEGGGEAVRALAVRLAGQAGRRLDETAPFVDGQLPSGVRLHAILPPLAADGAHVTLRVPARRALTMDHLVASGTIAPGLAPVLLGLVRHRRSFVVTGGTGVGKTTLLASLLAHVDPTERIVIVEDVRELRVAHPHVVRLEARPSNVEGAGEVTLTMLVRQALRMRPDRIVLGEARGAEVRELLAALNTGHEGGCGTLHANSAADVVARFEALGALAGLAPRAVHAQLASAVDVVVHVGRRVVAGRVSRAVETVGVLRTRRSGPPCVVEAVRVRDGRVVAGPGLARLAELEPDAAGAVGGFGVDT